MQRLSTKDNERNLCGQNLSTIENTDSDFHFTNELLKSKLAKQTETRSNYQKQVSIIIKQCFGNSQINSLPEERVFFHNFSLQNEGKSLRVQLVRADIVHSQCKIGAQADHSMCWCLRRESMRATNKALKIAHLNQRLIYRCGWPQVFTPFKSARGSQALIGRFETACIP